MTRDTAVEILTKYVSNKKLLQHSFATEATMQALARYFGEDEQVWGITGLLHDADYELSQGHPEKHGKILFQKEPNSIPSEVEHAIKSHNYEYTGITPQSRLDWAITCCDELTALIVACVAKTSEKKLTALSNEYVLKQIKSSGFARGANRKHIYLCEEKLGIPLIEFITVTLEAMQNIHDSLEL